MGRILSHHGSLPDRANVNGIAPRGGRFRIWRSSGAGGFEFEFFGRGGAHIPCQAHRFQQADKSIGKIDFPEAKAVAG